MQITNVNGVSSQSNLYPNTQTAPKDPSEAQSAKIPSDSVDIQDKFKLKKPEHQLVSIISGSVLGYFASGAAGIILTPISGITNQVLTPGVGFYIATGTSMVTELFVDTKKEGALLGAGIGASAGLLYGAIKGGISGAIIGSIGGAITGATSGYVSTAIAHNK